MTIRAPEHPTKVAAREARAAVDAIPTGGPGASPIAGALQAIVERLDKIEDRLDRLDVGRRRTTTEG